MLKILSSQDDPSLKGVHGNFIALWSNWLVFQVQHELLHEQINPQLLAYSVASELLCYEERDCAVRHVDCVS